MDAICKKRVIAASALACLAFSSVLSAYFYNEPGIGKTAGYL
jgi:hypothetical protein